MHCGAAVLYDEDRSLFSVPSGSGLHIRCYNCKEKYSQN